MNECRDRATWDEASKIVRSGLLLFLGFYLAALPLLAHKGKKHVPAVKAPKQSAKTVEQKLDQINARYVRDVKPIFRKKCFDCHATAARLPWYSEIPGPKQLIRRDMREAKKHMDMRKDFPFGGHGTPMEDLDALEGVLKDRSMPPLRYRIMHRHSKLTQEEIRIIKEWIEEGRRLEFSTGNRNTIGASQEP